MLIKVTMNTLCSIQAVVPAFNCSNTIGRVVIGVKDQGLDVLVIDDGSTDETAQRARDAGAIVLRHPTNKGKGYCLELGFRWSLAQGKTFVVTLDADGQHNPADLPQMLKIRHRAHLIVGHRKIQIGPMPTTSFIGNCISSFFISLFCGVSLPDTQCGFRIYSSELLRQIPLSGGAFETETEILMRASLLGMEILWVPIQTIYSDGSTPHHSNFRTTLDSLRVIKTVLHSPFFPRSVQ